MQYNKLNKILLSTKPDEIYFCLGENILETNHLAAGELLNGVGLTALIISGVRFVEKEDGKVIAFVELFPGFPKDKLDYYRESLKKDYEVLKENLKEDILFYEHSKED